MKRKTSSLPSRTYRYHVRLDRNDEAVFDRIGAQCKEYYAALVNIENQRRAATEEFLILKYPTFASLREEMSELEKRVKEKGVRKALFEVGKSFSKMLKELVAKEAESLKKFTAEAVRQKKIIRARLSGEGLPWGSYSKVEMAFFAACRKGGALTCREKETGESIAVQIQCTKPCTVDGLRSDRRIQISTPPTSVWSLSWGERKRAARTVGKIRIGTQRPGREPVWFHFAVTYHRPLPEDATLKWAWIGRSPRHGRSTYRRCVDNKERWRKRYEYYLYLTVESSAFISPLRAPTGKTAAIDVDVEVESHKDGRLSIGELTDSNERRESIFFSEHLLNRFQKCDELQSIRDKNHNRLVEDLREVEELLTAGFRKYLLGEEHRISHLHHLITYETLENKELSEKLHKWAKQDRHLNAWKSEQRAKTLRQRREKWQLLAIELADYYDEITISAPASLTVRGHWDGNFQKKCAAAGEFIDVLSYQASKRGCKIVKVKKNVTEG